MISNPETPAFKLLLLSVRQEDTDETVGIAEEMISTGNVDWDDLYARAEIHSVRPQIARLVRKIPSPAVPGDFREKINGAYESNLGQQLRYVTEFFRLKQTLDEAGITVVPFKGFWLAYDVYGNLADREGGDIDLLINFKDLDRVIALMPEAGYIPETSGAQRFINEIKRVSAEYNFERFEDGEKAYHIEFHWKIGSAFHGLDISIDDFASQIVTGTIQNRDLHVFSPSANLLLAVMHHAGKDALVKLKHVADIGRMVSVHRDIEWEWVINTARKYNIEKAVYLSLKLASLLTGVEVPEQVEARVESEEIRRLAEGRIRAMARGPGWLDSHGYNFDSLKFHLQTRTGFRLKSRMTYDHFRSVIKGAITPKKLLRVYLKKRYNIDQ